MERSASPCPHCSTIRVAADAYEYYYGDHREEGQELLNTYCSVKAHQRVKVSTIRTEFAAYLGVVQVEAPRQQEATDLPPQLPKVSIPSVFLAGE